MPITSRLLCGVAQLVRGGLQDAGTPTTVCWDVQIVVPMLRCWYWQHGQQLNPFFQVEQIGLLISWGTMLLGMYAE
jgi:hypothetical protein